MSIEGMGGRKFILTIIALIIGTAVQVLSPKGVTTEFAALLAGLLASFTAANAFITNSSQGASTAEPIVETVAIVDNSRIEKVESDIANLASITMTNSEGLSQVAKTAETAAKLAKSALGLNS